MYHLVATRLVRQCGRFHSAKEMIGLTRPVLAHGIRRGATTLTVAEEEWSRARPFDEIPGPKPLPLVGNWWRFLPVIGEYWKLGFQDQQQKVIQVKFGNLVRLSGIPGRPATLMVFDPACTETIVRNDGLMPIRGELPVIEYYRKVLKKDFFKGVPGLLISNGKEWQKFRSIVNQPMMEPRTARRYVGPIDKVAVDFVSWIEQLRDDKGEMPADFNNHLFRWALESITYITLDTRLGCLDPGAGPESEPQQVIDAVHAMMDGLKRLHTQVPIWKVFPTPSLRKYIAANDLFLKVCRKHIDQAIIRRNSMPNDHEMSVLERILERSDDPKVAVVMAQDMMFVGIDTTAYSSASLLHHLALNPDKQQRLYEEVKAVLPSSTETVTEAHLDQMKYLKACIKESMRLTPAIAKTRRVLQKDLVVGGFRVPKGTNVLVCHMPNIISEEYFPQATKFEPERWLKDNTASQQINPFVFLPFGIGARMCVGRRFAEMEIATLISRIIQRFQVEFHYGGLETHSHMLFYLGTPLKFRMIDRS